MVVESSTDKAGENAWDESVSVLMDNEPSDFDPMNLDMSYGRQVWDQYHLIGDVMRNQELAFQPSEMFYARLSKALEQEPVHQAKRQSLWPWGLSIAASVVLSVGVWLFSQSAFDESLEHAPALVPVPASSASSATNSIMAARPAPDRMVKREQNSPVLAALAMPESQDAHNTGLYMAFAFDKVAQLKEFVSPPAEQFDLSQVRNSESADTLADPVQHAMVPMSTDQELTSHELTKQELISQESTSQERAETASTITLAETAEHSHQSSQVQASQTSWQNHFKTLIEQHNRTAGTRLTVPVSLRGVIAP